MKFGIGYLVIGIIALLLIWVVTMYNGFIRLKNTIEEAFSTMDVYLKKRYDLIPNLVETVKGYAAHESGTFEKVVQARNMAANATSIEEKLKGENLLQSTLRSLFALAESYPDLKANTNFLDLQDQLNRVENEIASARKYYNAVVREFNTKIEAFPSNLVAGIFGFTRKPMFEVEDAQERQNVQVKF